MAEQTNTETLKEFGRGVIGGLLISLPLIYTMEVWWNGFTAPPSFLLSCLLVTYLLLLGYNRYAGMKEDSSFSEICWESVEEIGLGFLASFLFLLLLGRINMGMSLDEIAGKVIVETVIVAIGISVGTAQMGGNGDKGPEKGKGAGEKEGSGSEKEAASGSKDSAKEESSRDTSGSGEKGEGSKEKDNPNIKRLILSVCGAVLFASSVAPTEEILMIAVEAEVVELILMLLTSLLLGGIVIYFSEFKGAHKHKEKPGGFVILLDLSVMYSVAMLVSFTFLWFFGRIQDYSLAIILAQMVVLGIPASLGASAGRFLIGG